MVDLLIISKLNAKIFIHLIATTLHTELVKLHIYQIHRKNKTP